MSYTHLNAKERHSLMYFLQMGLSYREIGRRLGRDAGEKHGISESAAIAY